MKKLLFILAHLFLLASCNLSRTNFAVSNEAMLPNISIGSHVTIMKDFDKLDYGDIVVFKFDGKVDVGKRLDDLLENSERTEYYEELHGYFVFRIIGLPNDSIAINNDTCIINGKKNQLSFIRKGTPNKDIDKMYRQHIEEYEELLPRKRNEKTFIHKLINKKRCLKSPRNDVQILF